MVCFIDNTARKGDLILYREVVVRRRELAWFWIWGVEFAHWVLSSLQSDSFKRTERIRAGLKYVRQNVLFLDHCRHSESNIKEIVGCMDQRKIRPTGIKVLVISEETVDDGTEKEREELREREQKGRF